MVDSGSNTYSGMQAEVELITRKAQGIEIDEAKKPQTDMTGATSRKGMRKKIANVVRSSYSPISGFKGMDVNFSYRKCKGKEKKTGESAAEKVRKRMKRDLLSAGRKSKGKETESRDCSGNEADTEERVRESGREEIMMKMTLIKMDLNLQEHMQHDQVQET